MQKKENFSDKIKIKRVRKKIIFWHELLKRFELIELIIRKLFSVFGDWREEQKEKRERVCVYVFCVCECVFFVVFNSIPLLFMLQ